MDKTNQQTLDLKVTNKLLSDLLIFFLVREGYSNPQIRAILGKIDNNRVRKIRVGLKNKKK